MALAKDPALSKFTAQDSGEGRWTIQSAIEESISSGGVDRNLVRPFPLQAGAYICRKDVVGYAQ